MQSTYVSGGAANLQQLQHAQERGACHWGSACSSPLRRGFSAQSMPSAGDQLSSRARAALAGAFGSASLLRTWQTRRRCAAATQREAAALASESIKQREREEPSGRLSGGIFLWQMPLDLPPPFPPWLATVLPKHSVVLAECDGGWVAFDFEPKDKNDLLGAMRLLAGGAVDGRLRTRCLRSLPSGASRIGKASETAVVEDVTDGVNAIFDQGLMLNSNDCHTYSQRVLKAILAEADSNVEKRLFSTVNWDSVEIGRAVEYKEPSLFNAVVLVAGTTVGAGVLALPAATQEAGFIPSTSALFFAWMYMATSGLLIAEVSLATMASSSAKSTSLQSMAERTIGPSGALLSSVAFAFLHCSLLIAYCSRGGELFVSLFPVLAALPVPGPAIFAAIFGGFVWFAKGTDLLDQVNNIFALAVLVAFFGLVGLAAPSGEASRLLDGADWSKAPDTLPTLLLSLVYHNIVPTICSQLEGDRSKISMAIVGGSLLPFLMFVIWNAAVLAAIPPGMASGGDPLEVLRATGGSLVGTSVLGFSLCAIVTSFFGFVISLTDFYQDLFKKPGESEEQLGLKLRNFALTLVPPVLVSCYDPSLFFQAIDKAGAFGVSTLFGFLPALMVLMQRASDPQVLVKDPSLVGGYARGPLVPGGILVLAGVAAVALGVIIDNALELIS